VATLAIPGCATSPTPVDDDLLGLWGGPHVSMEITSQGAQMEYDCADGVIGTPIRPDTAGRFTASGTHTPGHGGPIRVGEVLPSFRARYDGRIDGDRMDLSVTLTDSGTALGPFQLRRGRSALLVKCV
jgi:hypothetical protein